MAKSERVKRAVLYARISQDSSGVGAGVDRQLADARAYAAQRGWTVVAEEADNDISALLGRHRPAYERVMRLARRREVDYVVVWQSSRFWRNRKERAAAIEELAAARVGVMSVRGADFDLTTAQGRMLAGMLGEVDTAESEIKGERAAAAGAQRVAAGHAYTRPGYGWDTHGERFARTYTLNAHEAAVVRELARETLRGKSALSLARAMNERGEPVPGGTGGPRSRLDRPRAWTAKTVRLLLLRPANVARAVHRKGTPEEATYPALWPPILTERQYAALVRLHAARRPYGGRVTRPGKRTHLLTHGVARCGVCGDVFQAKQWRYTSRRTGETTVKWSYRCLNGCTQRGADDLDAFARDVAIARLSRPDSLAWLAGDDAEAVEAAAEVTRLRTRLDEAADAFAAGEFTREQVARINAEVRPALARAEERHNAAVRSLDVDLLRSLAGPEAEARWEALDVAQRRAVLEAIGLTIRVDRATSSRRRRDGVEQETLRVEFGGES